MLEIKTPKQHARRLSQTSDSPIANNLATKLAELHRDAKGIGVIIFGIKYAQEIEDCGHSVEAIVRLSGVPASYGREIYKGIRLVPYVSLRRTP